MKNVTQGGGRKNAKKSVTYYLNDPLEIILKEKKKGGNLIVFYIYIGVKVMIITSI
jgi:hypothetical protein